MDPIIFALGSTSPHKVAAVQAAFTRIGSWSGGHPELQLRPVAVALRLPPVGLVPPQPIGLNQTCLGAWLRADAALRAVPEARYAIGIESGLVDLGISSEPYVDLAAVALVTRAQGGHGQAAVFTTSTGVPMPGRYVQQSIGAQQKVEAGRFYAEEHGCDPTDFISHLTRGVLSRVEQMSQAVLAALAIERIRTEP